MKIRSSFVSNSSSSSFILFGCKIGKELTEQLMTDILVALGANPEKECEKYKTKNTYTKNYSNIQILGYAFRDYLDTLGLTVLDQGDGDIEDSVYIGERIVIYSDDATTAFDIDKINQSLEKLQKLPFAGKGEIVIGNMLS
jgi:hypothetical protein